MWLGSVRHWVAPLAGCLRAHMGGQVETAVLVVLLQVFFVYVMWNKWYKLLHKCSWRCLCQKIMALFMCKLQQEQKLLQKSWELSRYIENCCYGDRTPNPSNLNDSILYLKKKNKHKKYSFLVPERSANLYFCHLVILSSAATLLFSAVKYRKNCSVY